MRDVPTSALLESCRSAPSYVLLLSNRLPLAASLLSCTQHAIDAAPNAALCCSNTMGRSGLARRPSPSRSATSLAAAGHIHLGP